MIFLWKEIRPKKLKIDQVRLTLLSMLHKMDRELTKDFKATTETWEHKPEFESIISLKGGASLLVGTDDEIYGWVNNGTPEHDIEARIPGAELKFLSGFQAKTIPGKIASRKGRSYGAIVRKQKVHHPGIKPRRFDLAIKKKWENRFKKYAQDALNEFARKSGHQYNK